MSSPKSPKTALSKLGLSRPKPIRILVLGQDGVGKSALVVRYLTRRFIGEYDPNLEKIYPFSTIVESETVFMEILDSAGLSNESDCVRLEANIRWADVFLLMYSVADKCSFDECNRLKFLINYNKRKRKLASPTSKEVMWEVPVLLIGNKKDISGDRMISTAEGIKRSQDIGCVAFHETSVRESIEEVVNVFNDAIKFWRDVYKSPKIRRASSELPGSEYYQSLQEAGRGNPAQHTPISDFSCGSSSEGFLSELTSRLRLGRKTSNEEVLEINSIDIEIEHKSPYRGRASTDGWLHQRRMKNLRMSLCLRGSLIHERRMSIAMRGESSGF